MIPFNRQNIFGEELNYIRKAYQMNKVSGDGEFTRWCNSFIEQTFQTEKALLTTSGTHALEMAMLLAGLKSGDEVILPSYTFVSTVNALVLRGARPVFVDIREDTMNMDEQLIEALITPDTKMILPVHYAGVACEMEKIMKIAARYDLVVVEDAAQGVNAKYNEKYLGTIGDLGCYSFHETKNYSMGEGGALLVNRADWIERAEILREKGTNRTKFFRGEVDKYTWVDIGSSYLPSEVNAAILKVQFEHLDQIQRKRDHIYARYHSGLQELEEAGHLKRPFVPAQCTSNSHLYHILTRTAEERSQLLRWLKEHGVYAVFHYVPLHNSEYSVKRFGNIQLPVTENLSARLIRLPMFYSLKDEQVSYILEQVHAFYER